MITVGLKDMMAFAFGPLLINIILFFKSRRMSVMATISRGQNPFVGGTAY